MRKVIITNAAVSDSLVFEELLDPNNTSRDVYADRGYPRAEREATLTATGWRLQIQRKGSANKPISDTQKQRNRRIATPRARVEHVFGAMRHMGRKTGALHGNRASHPRVAPKAASYNLQWLVYLKERGLQAF